MAHGIHLHATGSCSPDFKAATGHINPDQLPHCAIPMVPTTATEFFTTRVSVPGGDLPALLDADGSALIIHDQPDDHLSQPIGDAGGRIACGVITIVRDCQEGCRGAQPGSGHPRHRWRAIHPAMQRSTQLPQIV